MRLPVENSYQVLQIMNTLFGLSGLALFFTWLYKSTEHYWLSLGAMIFLAFSALYWTYSVDAQVYIVSAFFVILTYYAAFKYTENSDWHYVIFLAFASSLAILAHQSNVLLVIPCLWLIGKRQKVLGYLGIILLLAGIPYLMVMVFQHHAGSVKQGITWLAGAAGSYGPMEYQNPYWSFNPANLLLTCKSVFGVLWTVADSWWKLTGAILMGLVAFNLSVWREKKDFYRFALVTIGLYLLFFSVWNPGNGNYLLGVGILLIYMVALTGTHYSRRSLYALYLVLWSMVLMITFWVNYENIYAHTDIKNNRDYGIAAAIAEKVKPQDVVITAGLSGYQAGKVYLPYFYNIQCLSLDLVFPPRGKEKGLAFLRDLLAQSLKQPHPRIYVLSEVFDDARTEELLKKYWQITPREVYNIFQPYRLEKVAVLNQGTEPMVLFRISK